MAQKLTLEQREVLVGILLGDANLQTESNGRTYRLRVTQAEQNKEYLFALYELFKPLVNTPPKLYTYSPDKRTNNISERWAFATTQHGCFRFYGKQFYVDGKKRVPLIIEKWLTPRSLAYWYMDDGAQKWKGRSLGVVLCTDGFGSDEVYKLAAILTTKYNLKTSVQVKGNGLRLYISTTSYSNLKRLIYPHLLPSMLYKFPVQVATTPSDEGAQV
uniref:Putative LAGLIDADG homing endonuclease n=1 Tax=Pseudococcomyxa simplex TaxID=464287 RepID=I1TJ12_9CHLO|nr:putative LAGLIDADG homing endonuclease [Pseudococcomyxa simplex]